MTSQTDRIDIRQEERRRNAQVGLLSGVIAGVIGALLLVWIAKGVLGGAERFLRYLESGIAHHAVDQQDTRAFSLKLTGFYKTGEDFGIPVYVSGIDMDGDGIDDQTDILQNAKEWVSREPYYLSEYYDTGYPDWSMNVGVCTDVVGYALLNSGYDLMALVNADIEAHPERYPDAEDPNIDFRRVENLLVFFQYNATSLTTDVNEISEWQGGDIVIFAEGHIGIVSDRRNADGNPYLIHHGSVWQTEYEEDKLHDRDDIVGHFRIS